MNSKWLFEHTYSKKLPVFMINQKQQVIFKKHHLQVFLPFQLRAVGEIIDAHN